MDTYGATVMKNATKSPKASEMCLALHDAYLIYIDITYLSAAIYRACPTTGLLAGKTRVSWVVPSKLEV